MIGEKKTAADRSATEPRRTYSELLDISTPPPRCGCWGSRRMVLPHLSFVHGPAPRLRWSRRLCSRPRLHFSELRKVAPNVRVWYGLCTTKHVSHTRKQSGSNGRFAVPGKKMEKSDYESSGQQCVKAFHIFPTPWTPPSHLDNSSVSSPSPSNMRQRQL